MPRPSRPIGQNPLITLGIVHRHPLLEPPHLLHDNPPARPRPSRRALANSGGSASRNSRGRPVTANTRCPRPNSAVNNPSRRLPIPHMRQPILHSPACKNLPTPPGTPQPQAPEHHPAPHDASHPRRPATPAAPGTCAAPAVAATPGTPNGARHPSTRRPLCRPASQQRQVPERRSPPRDAWQRARPRTRFTSVGPGPAPRRPLRPFLFQARLPRSAEPPPGSEPSRPPHPELLLVRVPVTPPIDPQVAAASTAFPPRPSELPASLPPAPLSQAPDPLSRRSREHSSTVLGTTVHVSFHECCASPAPTSPRPPASPVPAAAVLRCARLRRAIACPTPSAASRPTPTLRRLPARAVPRRIRPRLAGRLRL